VAEWNEQAPWRPDSFGGLAEKLNADRGDSPALELGGDQTDRLVTGRSDGHEKRYVDFVLLEQLGCAWGRLPDQPSRSRDRAHERENALVE